MRRFGEIVRSERQAQGLTLETLAKRTYTHKGYISGIENGKVSPPSVGLVKRLAWVLKLKAFPLILTAATEKLPREVRRFVQDAVQAKLG